MPIDRCICHAITFKEIKRLAEENGYVCLEEVQKAGVSSTKCKMCEPYVRAVLKTGETSFRPGFYLK